jgi:hypothetical protein
MAAHRGWPASRLGPQALAGLHPRPPLPQPLTRHQGPAGSDAGAPPALYGVISLTDGGAGCSADFIGAQGSADPSAATVTQIDPLESGDGTTCALSYSGPAVSGTTGLDASRDLLIDNSGTNGSGATSRMAVVPVVTKNGTTGYVAAVFIFPSGAAKGEISFELILL